MAPRRRPAHNQPVVAYQDDGYTSSRASSVERTPIPSRFTALILTVPGIVIYAYILYTMISKLVYPGSFSPFSSTTRPLYHEGNTTGDPTLARAILLNSGLVLLFFVQHTMMVHLPVRSLFDRLNIPAVNRPFYITCTCIAINIMNSFWQVTPDYVIWSSNSRPLNLVLMLTHTACWLSIATSVFTIDYLELLGIKQLYYAYYGFGDPMHYKSREQQQLLEHNRHPIFLGPLVILWAVPVMTYDRLLVAIMLPLYLGCGSVINDEDVFYVKSQFNMKRRQLLANGMG